MITQSEKEKDLGTPSPNPLNSTVETETVTLTINHKQVTAPKGTTVMRAAAEAGIDIPKLCATDCLTPLGGCRMCLVEIEGRRGTPASCTTLVEENMKVETATDKIVKLRKNIMELYLSDHEFACLTCYANGSCDLQKVAGDLGIINVKWDTNGKKDHAIDRYDRSNPYFVLNRAKCISCYKCVRACTEVQGQSALSIEMRGFDSRITTSTKLFIDSNCVSCGKCVEVCPTASLMEKSVIKYGQPNKIIDSTCAYCGVGCGIQVHVNENSNHIIKVTPLKSTKSNRGHQCVKGRFAYDYNESKDRILKPMIRESIKDEWQEVTHEEAVAFTAKKLLAIQKKHGSEAIGGVCSSRTTAEEIYLVQKMLRTALKTNNIDNCARRCHSPTGYGLNQTLGTSAGTQDFDSIEDVDTFLICGANPTEAHPVVGSKIKQRVKKGAKLIIIDPREIELVRSPEIQAETHIQLDPGTNVAVLNSLAHVIVKENLHNKEYMKDKLDKTFVKDYLEFITKDEHSPENVAKIANVSADDLYKAGRLYATSENSSIFYGLGVTEHEHGSDGVMALANLAMLTGNLGRSGVGINPLRGQNNVQGACDMGAYPDTTVGYQKVTDEKVNKKFEKLWNTTLAKKEGLKLPEMLDSAIDGKFKAMFIQGEDFVQSEANVNHVIKALENMDFVLLLDQFMNETAPYAHVVFPATTFLEKDGVFINAERRINRVRQAVHSKIEKQEWQTISDISTALGYEMSYDHPSEIWDEIATLSDDFSGVSYAKLDEVGSVQWPCNKDNPNGTNIMHVEKINRKGGGALQQVSYIPSSTITDKNFPLVLMTGRDLMHYNVGTHTRRTHNMRWHDKDVLLINPFDAKRLQLMEKELVKISSEFGNTNIEVMITRRIKPGTVFTTFHHPEVNINFVTSDKADKNTKCPDFKNIAVNIEKIPS